MAEKPAKVTFHIEIEKQDSGYTGTCFICWDGQVQHIIRSKDNNVFASTALLLMNKAIDYLG